MFKCDRHKKKVYFLLFIAFSIIFSGCSTLDKLKVSFRMKNNDFEYIKENKINKIIIQNTRDPGYRFIVTDKRAINDLYDILSKAKEVDKESELKPDYIFEMHESHDKIHKFQYIVGLDKKNGGNLYGDGKVYIVSKRIDNDIIKSFWDVRIPKDFTSIYYDSILEILDNYLKDNKGTNKTIGINLDDDIEVGKFILSKDLEEFKNRLKKYKGVYLVEEDDSKYDVVMTLKTQGYRRLLYKSSAIFHDRVDRNDKNYYLKAEYENRSWNVECFNKKPGNF